MSNIATKTSITKSEDPKTGAVLAVSTIKDPQTGEIIPTRYLEQIDTGRIYIFHEILAERSDVREFIFTENGRQYVPKSQN